MKEAVEVEEEKRWTCTTTRNPKKWDLKTHRKSIKGPSINGMLREKRTRETHVSRDLMDAQEGIWVPESFSLYCFIWLICLMSLAAWRWIFNLKFATLQSDLTFQESLIFVNFHHKWLPKDSNYRWHNVSRNHCQQSESNFHY